MKRVTLLPGDGIGPEITDATIKVLEAAGVKITWDIVPGGMTSFKKTGNPLPDETIESFKKNKVLLKGPLTTPVGGGYKSVNVSLRQRFDLFVNVRPAISIPGVKSNFKDIDLLVIRENTEDIYSADERYTGPDRSTAEATFKVTRAASERIVRYAFEEAGRRKKKKLTLVHKANILKCTSGLFLEVGAKVAREFPKIKYEEKIVDNMCMQLVINPHQFDVIVTTNLFGDILSDLTAGLVGGLGVAPGANIGKGYAMFEAVHGTAPDIAGKGVANPTAQILAACMMLDYMGETKNGERIRSAVKSIISKGKSVTKDLSGRATTTQFTKAVIDALE
ncbi:MAG: isocitrate dehydrogenase [Deltaproteobacteria bacterium RIFCSPHIGHO2_12_FULL_43_9]|nr:MAG: isocitrate dehydrogenase [Deltaproteobacteria bacterium RIFCSPHIGHO2_12_FULL_43_9]